MNALDKLLYRPKSCQCQSMSCQCHHRATERRCGRKGEDISLHGSSERFSIHPGDWMNNLETARGRGVFCRARFQDFASIAFSSINLYYLCYQISTINKIYTVLIVFCKVAVESRKTRDGWVWLGEEITNYTQKTGSTMRLLIKHHEYWYRQICIRSGQATGQKRDQMRERSQEMLGAAVLKPCC